MADALWPATAVASRRELLGGALGGIALGAVAPGAFALARSSRRAAGDAKLLNGLLVAERRLTGTYRRVLAAGVLNVVVAAEVSGFAAQEREHIGALERELLLRGQRLASEVPAGGGSQPGTQADGLNMLLRAEKLAEAAYFGALSKLQDPGLVQLAAEIMASEAQHWTLLRILQTPHDLPGSVPNPFVTGSP